MKKSTTKKVSSSKKASLNEMKKWEIESALNTLKRADEIRKDSKMMSDVKKLAEQQLLSLKNFTK